MTSGLKEREPDVTDHQLNIDRNRCHRPKAYIDLKVMESISKIFILNIFNVFTNFYFVFNFTNIYGILLKDASVLAEIIRLIALIVGFGTSNASCWHHCRPHSVVEF